MVTAESLRTQLDKFTGTENYYYNRMYPGLKYTSGVQYFLTSAEAYWFLDIIGFCLFPNQAKQEWPGFLTIIVLVSDDNKAVIAVEDGNHNQLHTQKVPYTDCPEGDWKLWLIDGVLLLPSEY